MYQASTGLHSSRSTPSPCNRHFLNTSHLVMLDRPGRTGIRLAIKAIQRFQQPVNKEIISVETLEVTAHFVRGSRAAFCIFKMLAPCSESNIYNVPAVSQLEIHLRHVEFIIWHEVVTCQHYYIDTAPCTMSTPLQSWKPFRGKDVLFYGDFRKIISFIEDGSCAQVA